MQRLLLLLVIIVLWSTPCSSVSVKHISVEQGLSQSVVFDIVQDSIGFIWIATQDGLNRYDGYHFKTFRFIPDDSTSISENWVTTLLVDRHFIWLGTHHGGVNLLDLRNETFTHFFNGQSNQPDLSDVWIKDLLNDGYGNLWIATWGKGLIRFTPATGQVLLFNEANGLTHNDVSCLFQIEDTLWVGTKIGLTRLTLPNPVPPFEVFFCQDSKELSRGNFIVSLEIYDGQLIVGTLGGLKHLEHSKKVLLPFKRRGPLGQQHVITALTKDPKGNLWIGTKKDGLYCLTVGHQFKHFSSNRIDRHRLSSAYVRCLLNDRFGKIWAGTWGGGINLLDPSLPKFDGIFGKQAQQLLGNPFVNAILKDQNGRLWIGTAQAGITVLDSQLQPQKHFVHQRHQPQSLSDNRVHALVQDNSGQIWVGTQKGLDKWNPTRQQFEHHLTQLEGELLIWKFFKDRFGVIWIGHQAGLIQFDPQTGAYREYDTRNGLAGNDITSIFEDFRGHLWVGSRANGLTEIIFDSSTPFRKPRLFNYYRYNPSSALRLCSNNILSIASHPDSILWIGTNQGLNRLNLISESIRYFYQADGLPNDVIYAIVPDKQGRLWLSTNRGLSCFDPATNVFRNFTPEHGLQSFEFNQGAFFKEPSTIYFGGINGFNFFNPEKIKNSRICPPLAITKILADGATIFNKGLPFRKEIHLPYHVRTLSFEFAALEFGNPSLNQYACFMEGIDKQWIYLGNRHAITYTNVGPGEYRFKVKASNTEGIWDSAHLSLVLHIPPPFWKTWWFISGLSLIIVGIIAFLITYRIKQLLAFERFQKQIAADLHDEIGAGLSEINILTAVIETRVPPEVLARFKNELVKIGERSRTLMQAMNDIIWLVKPKNDSLMDLTSHLKEIFNDLFEAKNIRFKINTTPQVKSIRLKIEDKHHLYLLCKEALHNAIKYSEASEIVLRIQVINKHLTLTLTDNGKGFDWSQIRSGQGIKNMQLRAERLKGTLNIHSQKGNGTTITFRTKLK